MSLKKFFRFGTFFSYSSGSLKSFKTFLFLPLLILEASRYKFYSGVELNKSAMLEAALPNPTTDINLYLFYLIILSELFLCRSIN